MKTEILAAVLLPFLGTTLGAAGVFFMKGGRHRLLQRALAGFAAGVMTAASIWSLLIPAMEQSAHLGGLAFFPAIAGVWSGFLFLRLLDRLLPCPADDPADGPAASGTMILAVALHNLPEGMAVGVAAAGWMAGSGGITAAAALTLAAGIALQNLPEGAIVSMPLQVSGMGRGKAFGIGVLSGAIEPIGAVITILLAGLVVPVLPYLLSFSAGAMLYVVVDELIPRMSRGDHADTGVLLFAAGFTVMMVLDVALG